MLKPKFRILHNDIGYFPQVKYLLFWHSTESSGLFINGFEDLEDAKNYFKIFDIRTYEIVEK